MAKLERTIEIEASPEDVYDKLADPSCLGEWVTIQDRLLSAPDGLVDKGDEIVQRMKVAHKRFDVTWDVEVAERPTKLRWTGRGPLGTKARATYELSPNGNGGTRFHYTNEYDLPGGPLGRMVGRAFSATSGHEADKTLERLKKLIERR